MIEIVMLLMLGGEMDMSTELAVNVKEQTDKVDELQLEYDLLKEELLKVKTDMNITYTDYIKWKAKENIEDEGIAMKSYYHAKAVEVKNEWRILNSEMKKIEKESDEIQLDLETAKILLERMEKDLENLLKANEPKESRYKNISISLSKNCQTMINYGLYTNCPTYAELFDLYDNTNPTVSGIMVDTKYDIERVDVMQRHWKFYESYEDFELVMVDPDSNFQHKSINIEIQSRNFTTLALVGNDNSRNFKNGSYTTWENFKVNDDCTKIIVAPDMELIDQAVEFAKNNCNGDIDILENTVIKQEPTPHNDRNWRDSPALVYQDWLRNAIENNKGLMLGLG